MPTRTTSRTFDLVTFVLAVVVAVAGVAAAVTAGAKAESWTMRIVWLVVLAVVLRFGVQFIRSTFHLLIHSMRSSDA